MSVRGALWDVAADQYGMITARQARNLGMSKESLVNMAARERLERVAHGVYRFPEFPPSRYDEYMLAVLWTGNPHARLSHDTALANFEVCDVNPDRTHISVPKQARIRRTGGELYVLHHAVIPAEQQDWWHRIPSVTLDCCIAQCIDTGLPTYLLRQALDGGQRQGLLTAAQHHEIAERLETRHA